MAAENALVITISGDTSDLQNSLKMVSQKIAEAGKQIGQQGAVGGKAFNEKLIAEFDKIEGLATGSFTGLARSFITLAANPVTLAIGGLGAALVGAFSLARVDEENKKVAKNFELITQNAGLNADDLKRRIAGIAEGFADVDEVLPVASEAVIKLGVNANRTAELFELSRNIGVKTGRDINEVFEQLTNGVARQNQKLLQNNLIKVDAEKAIRDFAAANNIAVGSLSNAAKQQAVLNAVLLEGKKNFKDTGGEVAPVEGGIRKLKLAANDLKDAFAALINSKLGTTLAAIASGAAGAAKALANMLTPKVEDNSLRGQMDEIKAKMDEIKKSKLDNPAFAEGYNRQLNELNSKMLALQNVQLAINKAQAETPKPSEDRKNLIDPEAERERLAKIQAINDEQRKVEYDAQLAQREALLALDDSATFAEREAEKLQIKQDAANNEYQLQLDKNAKIKDSNERAAADSLALAKKDAVEQKAITDQKIAQKRAENDAKQKIEENFWAASFNFAQGNADATKALSIAQAIRNTYQGATLALASYPPPFNVVAAASTVALGLSQVAKITAANQGALVTGGEVGKDTNPFLLSKGEIVAPAKSYDNVVDGEIRARGYVKGDENSETNALLTQILQKLETPSIVVNSDFLTDENSINRLADKLREAVQFRGASLS